MASDKVFTKHEVKDEYPSLLLSGPSLLLSGVRSQETERDWPAQTLSVALVQLPILFLAFAIRTVLFLGSEKWFLPRKPGDQDGATQRASIGAVSRWHAHRQLHVFWELSI